MFGQLAAERDLAEDLYLKFDTDVPMPVATPSISQQTTPDAEDDTEDDTEDEDDVEDDDIETAYIHILHKRIPDKYSHINFRPPAGARAEAKRGLEWRREFGRGGTAVGVARARDIQNGVELSPDTLRRMRSFFARHEVDKQGTGFSPGEDGFPSNGRIAWALWGGDPGQTWANKVVNQMDSADEED